MFSIETAIIDEIVRYNKVDCPFILSANFSEDIKEKVNKNLKTFIIYLLFGDYTENLFLQLNFPFTNFKFLI